jgi:hypothetical protein
MSTCQFCNKEFHNISNLRRHQKSCKDILKHENEVLKKNLEEKNKIIQTLQEEIVQLKSENMRCKLETENMILKQNAEERKNNYETLLDKFDRPINNNIITYNKTNVRQIVSKLEPICFDKIKESMSLLSNDYIDDGIKGFAKFLCDHSLNKKFITTDNSRSTIAYRTDFYDFIRDPECLTLINKTLKENNEEVIKKSLDRMEHYRQLMDKDEEEYVDCSDKAMKVYELKKFAEASIKENSDENIKAISNILCKHGLETYQNSI